MHDLEPFYHAEEPEVGEGEMLCGILHRANDGQGWQVAGIQLNKHLAKYLGRKVMLIFAQAETTPQEAPRRHVCDTCGFPLDELGECLRCQWYGVLQARQRREALFQEIDQIVEQCWAD
jgi:hypothetical protein